MGDDDGLKIGPLNITGLPPWCRAVIGSVAALLALALAAIYAWTHGGEDMFRPEVHLSKLEAAQLIESAHHVVETPVEQYPVTSSKGDGMFRHYAVHDCTSTSWPQANGRTRTTFTLHPDRERTMNVERELEDLGLSSVPVSSAGFGRCEGPGPGCCLDPHPPPWDEAEAEYVSPCIARIWRYFEPEQEYGCVHFQDYNHCLDLWASVEWVECYH